jgi:hypothetical protein
MEGTLDELDGLASRLAVAIAEAANKQAAPKDP